MIILPPLAEVISTIDLISYLAFFHLYHEALLKYGSQLIISIAIIHFAREFMQALKVVTEVTK